MKHHVSPITTFFMGLFMIVSGGVYTSIISMYINLSTLDSITRLWFGIPAIFLILSGIVAMVYACIMMNTLKFDAESEEWVVKQE